MFMKKNKIKLIGVFIIILAVFCIMNNAYAINTAKYEGITQIGEIGAFGDLGGKIIYILQFVGYTVAVIMLAIMGIKYIMSSPNEKADIKSRLTPYLIGTFILFAGATVLNIIYRIIDSAK